MELGVFNPYSILIYSSPKSIPSAILVTKGWKISGSALVKCSRTFCIPAPPS